MEDSRITAGMVFRDPPWSSGEQQERELQRARGCTSLVFEVFLPDCSADVTPSCAPLRGPLECYPTRLAAVEQLLLPAYLS